MKSVKLISFLLLSGSLVAIVFQNQEPWNVHFLWLNGEVSGIILLLLTALSGFIAGIIVTLLIKHKAKKDH